MLFVDIRGGVGWSGFKKSLIDSPTFRLHYQYTFAILFIVSLLTATKQYLGDPIDCTVDGAHESVLQTYCWTQGTFTLPTKLAGRKGRDLSNLGVSFYHNNESDTYPNNESDPYLRNESNPNPVDVTEEGNEIHQAFLSMRQAWYLRIVCVLFFQAILCCIPHLLWKSWEGGKLSLLIQNLDENTLDTDPETTKEKRAVIVNYVLRNMRTQNIYAFKLVFCEFLNLINIIGQMFLIDFFFGGQLTTSAEVLSASSVDMDKDIDMDMEMKLLSIDMDMSMNSNRSNSMDMEMNMTSMDKEKWVVMGSKCTFHKFGQAGTIQNHDGLCTLPINIITEKIYLLLWFWFVVVASLTCVSFFFRIVTIVSRYSRYLNLCCHSKSSNKHDLAIILEKMWFGDYFILIQLSNNMNPMVFHDLVCDLSYRMDRRSDNLDMRNGYPNLPLLENNLPYPNLPLLEKNLPHPVEDGGEDLRQPYMDTP